ncbi:MAG TPA: helix-turn-helix transcriptional regulator [Candidatus Sulfotelmatobacter sp.]
MAKIFNRRFPANQKLRWPDKNVARVCVVMDGQFSEQLDRNVIFSRGDVLYRPADVRNPIQFGPSGMRSITIELLPEAAESLSQAGVLPKRALSVRSPRCLALATRITGEGGCLDPASLLVTEGLLLELIGEIGRCRPPISRPREPTWLKQVHSTISSEFAAPRSLAEYAELGGVHPTHLMRTFRAHYGLSIGEHIRNCRLDYAARMIHYSASRLTDIAVESGFADHSHMTNYFRRVLGLTPSEYRRLTKKR